MLAHQAVERTADFCSPAYWSDRPEEVAGREGLGLEGELKGEAKALAEAAALWVFQKNASGALGG
jgi:hypothetical protein